jgi:hypothetical protein
LDNDPFALDAMCAMISAVSKDFYVMRGHGFARGGDRALP